MFHFSFYSFLQLLSIQKEHNKYTAFKKFKLNCFAWLSYFDIPKYQRHNMEGFVLLFPSISRETK